MSQGWRGRRRRRGWGSGWRVEHCDAVLYPEGPAAGSLSFLFQGTGEISRVPPWGIGSQGWAQTQWPLVGTDTPAAYAARARPTVQGLIGPEAASAQGPSACVCVCVCVHVCGGRRASLSHVHRHARVTCPYGSPPVSTRVSVGFLHSAGVSACNAQGLAGQGDNGEQCRHRLWMMMCHGWGAHRRGQESGEVASWLCKEWRRAKEEHAGPGK